MSILQQFDPAAFLDLPVDAPSVKRPPIAAGDYTATIKDVVARLWQSKDKVDEQTGQLKSGLAYDVILTVEVPEAERTRIGLATTSLELKDGIMVDMTADGKGIDNGPGRNGQLRRYREALDMNKVGEVFRARGMLGKLLTVRLAHREYPIGSGDLFEEVKGVARIGG